METRLLYLSLPLSLRNSNMSRRSISHTSGERLALRGRQRPGVGFAVRLGSRSASQGQAVREVAVCDPGWRWKPAAEPPASCGLRAGCGVGRGKARWRGVAFGLSVGGKARLALEWLEPDRGHEVTAGTCLPAGQLSRRDQRITPHVIILHLFRCTRRMKP